MYQTDFELNGIPNRYQDQVQRYAVLYALRRPVNRLSRVYDETHNVINMWRARIGRMSDLGWEVGGDRHSAAYARNCRPTFAMAQPPTRPCHLRDICPFCFARKVRDIWYKIDPQFASGRELGIEPPGFDPDQRTIMLDDEPEEDSNLVSNYRFHLIERHKYGVTYAVPPGAETSNEVIQSLVGSLQALSNSRGILVKRADPIGAFSMTTVEPYRGGDKWRVHNRFLFKVPASYEVPNFLLSGPNVRLIRHEEPTRRCVMQAVARACRYPTQLIRGDAERTIQYLLAKRQVRFRSTATYRSFRNAK